MPEKIKLFIVEDNEDERLFMKEGFIQSGRYEIVGEAENGNEMLDFLNSNSLPEVIISDLNMPGKNGYDVICEVRMNPALSHIPIIILTTAPMKPYAERCKKLGANAYYTKPETFLEYREFSEKIYDEVVEFIAQSRLDYRCAGDAARPFIDKAIFSIRDMLAASSRPIQIDRWLFPA